MLSLLLLIQFIGKDNYTKQRQNSQRKKEKKREKREKMRKNNNFANHMTKIRRVVVKKKSHFHTVVYLI